MRVRILQAYFPSTNVPRLDYFSSPFLWLTSFYLEIDLEQAAEGVTTILKKAEPEIALPAQSFMTKSQQHRVSVIR